MTRQAYFHTESYINDQFVRLTTGHLIANEDQISFLITTEMSYDKSGFTQPL